MRLPICWSGGATAVPIHVLGPVGTCKQVKLHARQVASGGTCRKATDGLLKPY